MSAKKAETRAEERQGEFTTGSGRKVKRLYTRDDLGPGPDVGLPGEPPYTRGIQPTTPKAKRGKKSQAFSRIIRS